MDSAQKMIETVSLLGMVAEDRVTGFEGMIASVSFDAYGCIMIWLTPKMQKDGKVPDSQWFDLKRLIISRKRVLQVPDFGTKQGDEQGPASDKAAPRNA